MRKRLVITLLLAAMLTGLMLWSVQLMENKNQRMELYYQNSRLLEQQEKKLNEKEQELNILIRRYESGQTDAAAEQEALQQELEAMEAEKQELQLQLEQAVADVQAMRQQLESGDDDQSYYLEVYNALTEGLNKVKGYLAGN